MSDDLRYTEKAWAIRCHHVNGTHEDDLFRGVVSKSLYHTKDEAVRQIGRLRASVARGPIDVQVKARQWTYTPIRVLVTVAPV